MRKPKPLGSDLDIPDLGRQLDKTKAKVFLGKNASFFGSLLCSMNFYWTADIKTAATDDISLMWNPYWFMKLNQEQRATVLMHELWHPARLHMIRRGDRDHQVFNVACDHRINNDLLDEGYDFKGLSPCLDRRYKDMVEEDIYEDLLARKATLMGSWTGQPYAPSPDDPESEEEGIYGQDGDMIPGLEDVDPTAATQAAIGRIVQAKQVADLAGESTPLDGATEAILKQFLAPIVPWDVLLHRFMQELVKAGRSWNRPNRRYPDLYLPSTYLDKKKLEHLVFFEDVSGSISDRDALRFNSEVKFIKEKYDPKLLTLVQFDQEITQEVTFTQQDKFNEIKIVGRRGTDLTPVRDWIIKNRPTAAIIFSDLYCTPMEPLPFVLPTIWVALANKDATVNFGQLCHIRG